MEQDEIDKFGKMIATSAKPTPPALPDEAGEIVRRLALEMVCPNTMKPETIFEINMVKTFSEFGLRFIERLTPRWISVEERLPELLERVLCCGKGPDMISHTFYDAWLQPEQGGTPAVWMMFGRMRLLEDAVTHWQPLPLPPQKGST